MLNKAHTKRIIQIADNIAMDKIADGALYINIDPTIVFGPLGSGKTTYVNKVTKMNCRAAAAFWSSEALYYYIRDCISKRQPIVLEEFYSDIHPWRNVLKALGEAGIEVFITMQERPCFSFIKYGFNLIETNWPIFEHRTIELQAN